MFFFYPFPRNLPVSHELYEKKENEGKRDAKKETERESEAYRVRPDEQLDERAGERKRRESLESSLAIGHPFRSTWDEGSRSTEKFNKAHAPD